MKSKKCLRIRDRWRRCTREVSKCGFANLGKSETRAVKVRARRLGFRFLYEEGNLGVSRGKGEGGGDQGKIRRVDRIIR